MSYSSSNAFYRRLHFIALPLAGVIWLIYLAYRAPGWIYDPYWSQTVPPPVSGILSLIVGYGLAPVALLACSKQADWRQAFAFRPRKMVSAAALMAVTPVMFWGSLPLFPALLLPFLGSISAAELITTYAPVILMMLAAWYSVISVVSTHDWMRRAQMIGCVGAVYAGVVAAVFLALREGYF